MTLAAGTRLGPYQIVARIGAGGMGEVYRATDTTLRRDVAVKVLPHAVEGDADRIARFEREAQTLAALNHPNIAQIYGLEKAGGADALIMELVEGSTLAERIANGSILVEEALDIASQIAAGLEAAHEAGIVHRDLKPTNVMLRPDGTVKILDFGIAKALRPVRDPSGARTPAMTESGIVVGTTAYMSPEQARNRPVDRRTDVWAFACVLYEMLTGQPAFGGEDDTITQARLLERDPDFRALPASVPPAVRQTVRLCLRKDPAQRPRDMGDVRLALGGAFDAGEARATVGPGVLAVLGILAVIVVAGGSMWMARTAAPLPDQPLMRLTIEIGASVPFGPTPAISPDGTRIVYRTAGADGIPQLATRLLSDNETTFLRDTERAYNPSFSPDGQWVAYLAGNRLFKSPIRGGVPVPLAEAPVGRIGAWTTDGFIYAELDQFSGIFRVADDGSSVERLTQTRHHRHAWPQALPDGRVLYSAGLAGLFDNGRIEVLDPASGETRVVLEGGYRARYVASSGNAGHLLYLRSGALNAVSFDLETLAVSGEPTQLAGDVASTGAALANAFDVSETGTVVYTTGDRPQRWPIVWVEPDGTQQPLLASPRAYHTPRISNDGLRLAYSVDDDRGQDIFVYDIARDTTTRITVDAAANLWPVWAPDGEHLAFTSLTEDRAALWWARADGTRPPRLLLERDHPVRQIMLSPDGETLAFTEQHPETKSDLWTVSLDLTDPDAPVVGTPVPLLRTDVNEGVPAFSPDGKWLAYISDVLGPYDVWVQPLPGLGGRWQISSGGGGYPFWSAIEDALLFQGAAGMMRVPYTIEGERFVPGAPRLATPVSVVATPIGFEGIDFAPDGRLIALSAGTAATSEPDRVTFLLNVFDELRRRAPARR